MLYTFFRHNFLSISYISSSSSWGGHGSCAEDPSDWVASESPVPLSATSQKMVTQLTSFSACVANLILNLHVHLIKLSSSKDLFNAEKTPS